MNVARLLWDQMADGYTVSYDFGNGRKLYFSQLSSDYKLAHIL